MTAIAVTISSPAAKPWTARQLISHGIPWARPQSMEAITKVAAAIWKSRLRPNWSPNLPASTVAIVSARRYDETTHDRWPPPPRSPTIEGSAVETMVWSSAASSIPSATVVKTRMMVRWSTGPDEGSVFGGRLGSRLCLLDRQDRGSAPSLELVTAAISPPLPGDDASLAHMRGGGNRRRVADATEDAENADVGRPIRRASRGDLTPHGVLVVHPSPEEIVLGVLHHVALPLTVEALTALTWRQGLRRRSDQGDSAPQRSW